jgi:hypothetical protein
MKVQIFAAIFLGLMGATLALPQPLSSQSTPILKRNGGGGAECQCCQQLNGQLTDGCDLNPPTTEYCDSLPDCNWN